ncbi:MAG: PaeR7I family type II restriction endonuclease [Thermomicrobiales bacterium]
MIDQQARLQDAVQRFWTARDAQQQKQFDRGKIDAGTRGAVTGGTQMGALETLVVDLMHEAGLRNPGIKTRTGLELPGYFRPEKRWDLLVVADQQLVAAIEFKSQVGSVGKNFNNRAEEAIGNATDLRVAFRQGLLGTFKPFIGYLFLLQDNDEAHEPRKASEPYFPVDPIFEHASYCKRYQILLTRLVLEELYDATCLTLATMTTPTRVSHPDPALDFTQFAAQVKGKASAFAQIQSP